MQSITADGIDETIAGRPAPRRGHLAGVVLPRVLRRPARMLSKITWRPPRHIGVTAALLLFAATAGAGMVIGGHVTDFAAAVTTWGGLGIDRVRMTGQSRTGESDVLQKLAMGAFPSLVTFDIDAARARIQALPWVANATLAKVYPHDLDVVITERQPYAVWQDGDKFWLIDATGHTITDAVDDSSAGLPMVVGDGAAPRIGEFSVLLAAAPSIAARTRAGVLVGGRRWTLVLDSGIELMLPAADPASAIAAVARLDAETQLLSREIAAVDLRAPGAVVVRLDADEFAARSAFLKARAKLAKAKT